MVRITLIGVLILSVLEGCSQKKHRQDSDSVLNCILLGYDSVAFYYGSSNQMIALEKGKIGDKLFIDKVVQQAKKHTYDTAFQIKIKPTASADIANNFRDLVNILNDNNIENRSIDTLDKNEQLVFQTKSLQEIIEQLHAEPLRLYLPKADSTDAKTAVPLTDSAIIVLVFGKNGIYTYTGRDIESGRIYTYEEFNQFLFKKKSAGNITVLIKSSEQSTYSNVVDMLDLMTVVGIEKYSMIDITKEEENHLNKFKKRQ